jgi:hypothetical protein
MSQVVTANTAISVSTIALGGMLSAQPVVVDRGYGEPTLLLAEKAVQGESILTTYVIRTRTVDRLMDRFLKLGSANPARPVSTADHRWPGQWGGWTGWMRALCGIKT